jgi:hypothetical protein
MGSGKSRVVVEAARSRRLSPILILCPLRVVDVWTEQFARYGSEYQVLALGDQGAPSPKRPTPPTSGSISARNTASRW